MANFASRISRETVCLNRRLRLINIDTPFRCSGVVSPAEWKLQDHKLIAPAIYFRSAVANGYGGRVTGPQNLAPSVSACAGAFRPSVGLRRPEKSAKPPSSRARQWPERGVLMPIEGNIKGTKKPTCNRRRHSLFPFGRTQKPLLCALYSEVDSARASARV